MKRNLHKLLIILSAVLFPMLTQAQKRELMYYSSADRKTFAHWSYSVDVGTTIFNGDVSESHDQMFPTTDFKPTLGGTLERTFNPVFGLGVQYMYMPYQAVFNDNIRRVQGTAQEATAFLSLNFLNLFYQTRPQKWNVYGNVGWGVSFYNAETINRATGQPVLGGPASSRVPMKLDDGMAYVIPLALLIEYNVSRHFAIGAKAEYRMHNKDNYEGGTKMPELRQGNSNDAFMVFALSLRHKMNFGKGRHVRDATYGYGTPAMSDKAETKDLERRLNELRDVVEQMLEEMPTEDATACCKDAMKRIEILENQLSQSRIERPAPVKNDPKDDEETSRPTGEIICDFDPSAYETLTYVTAEKGTHLAIFSTQHYGNFMFWPYIYLANTDVLSSDPDALEIGTRLRIPKLPAEMIDENNPEAVERVNCIKEKIYEGR